MKLLKYEGYKVVIEPELLTLKPFKQIWTRDKTVNKDKALAEIAFIYFMADPRSDYQYLVDDKERMEAIKEGEGLPPKWQPDRIVTEAMDFYMSFKPISALLLEDTRFMVDKYRKRLKAQEFDDLEIKDLKEVGALIKQIPPLVRDLDEAEKALNSEMKSSGKMRGSGEKTIFEDDLTL
nr:MAG: hypothetical protein [Bacteriophage sp.]